MAIHHADFLNGNDGSGDGSAGNPYKTLGKAYSLATGGDRIRGANTAPFLESAISLATFTLNNSLYTILEAWDNGGSITVGGPDETPRVGMEVDLGVGSLIFDYSVSPLKFGLKNVRLTGGSARQILLLERWFLEGCEITRPSVGSIYSYNLDTQGGSWKIKNCYFHDIKSSINPLNIDGNSGVIEGCLFDNIESGGAFGDPYAIVDIAAGFTTLRRNKFINTTDGDVCIRIGYTGNGGLGTRILNNSFYSDNDNQVAIRARGVDFYGTWTFDHDIINNVFYGFSGTSDPIEFNLTTPLRSFGYNAYYDCNAVASPTQIAMDYTANDIVGVGSPFVNLPAYDFAVIPALRNMGEYTLDIGAVQSAGSSGGGNIFVLND